MNNIMLPAPHKILKVVKETRAEYTFRVAYEGETRHGQFFQLSIPKVGEAPISVSGKGEGWVEFTCLSAANRPAGSAANPARP